MEKYKNLTDAEQEWISECLLAKLQKKQGLFLFTELCTSKDGAVKTSFATSHKITKNGKLFSDGEFIKECLVASVVLIWTEKNYFRMHPSVTRWTEHIVVNLEFQLKSKAENFGFFSLALDDTCDDHDTPVTHLYMKDKFEMMQELAVMHWMKSITTGSGSITEADSLDGLGLKWDKLAADGCQNLTGSIFGLYIAHTSLLYSKAIVTCCF